MTIMNRFSESLIFSALLSFCLLLVPTAAQGQSVPSDDSIPFDVSRRPGMQTPQATQHPPPPQPPGMELPSTFPANCDVWWGDRFWAGSVLERMNNNFFVTYPGWARSWDEWVTQDRLRCPGTLKPSGPLITEKTNCESRPDLPVEFPEHCDARRGSRWYGVDVLSREGCEFRVRYRYLEPGFSEKVPADRIRCPGTDYINR